MEKVVLCDRSQFVHSVANFCPLSLRFHVQGEDQGLASIERPDHRRLHGGGGIEDGELCGSNLARHPSEVGPGFDGV